MDSDSGMAMDSDSGMAMDSDSGMAMDSDSGMARDSDSGRHISYRDTSVLNLECFYHSRQERGLRGCSPVEGLTLR
jgi:hypothetical protein